MWYYILVRVYLFVARARTFLALKGVLDVGWFTKGEGEQVCVEPIARASIACAYEAEIEADSQEKAFATAYLALALDENATVQKTQITQMETGFLVRIEYIAIESINF
jgi:hypothetical protein